MTKPAGEKRPSRAFCFHAARSWLEEAIGDEQRYMEQVAEIIKLINELEAEVKRDE